VSAPLFLVAALPGSGGPVHLDGPEGHHAATVQRLRVGEELVLADGRGHLATGRVLSVGKGALDVQLEPTTTVPAADPSLTVVQGIAKGERGELAVQAMTEAGVDAIVPWAAARSVARWKDERPLERWRATAREAAKQARRAWLPEVFPPESSAAVARRLSATALVLDEGARARLSTVDLPAHGEIVVVVGPEGGVTPDELAQFEAAGAVPVRLGPSVLRTSTAGVAAIAALSVRLGRW
jgi:16S rRNA (uracil1498-N3)-methyltransferase